MVNLVETIDATPLDVKVSHDMILLKFFFIKNVYVLNQIQLTRRTKSS